MIPREAITGLVLAGGAGRRMGGVDKGLQRLGDRTLARHALDRLAPQVGGCLVSANRHLDAYARYGVPVVTDAAPGHPGPLAGLLAGLSACPTDWLLGVPCDTPCFPLDLAERLAATAVAEGVPLVQAATRTAAGGLQPEPVFTLVRRTCAPDLADFIAAGGASPRAWAARLGGALAAFDDAAAFDNANTPEALAQLDRRLRTAPAHR